VRRWRRHLAAERAEAKTYRSLAEQRDGEEREILLALAEAEARHEAHWLGLLGDAADAPGRVDVRTRLLGWLARRFGSVFILALVQRAEARSPYDTDADATAAMAADEQIHAEVVRGLAARGRNRLSGTFRAAVFGANDGLVSNFALVLGIGATGASSPAILATGLAGLLAGALSMGAGEYVSVTSQRELLDASVPDPEAREALPHLDLDANELALVYRARGMSEADADREASQTLSERDDRTALEPEPSEDQHEAIGTGMRAAVSSFAFFASGAAIPVLPFLVGARDGTALVAAAILVGLALLLTGSVVGLLSGGGLLKRSLRQLAIGYGAAAATYALGLLLGGTMG
jgi:VIT1/CCC1 family predicted Fe2+/Mn2+ transporter